MNATQMVRKGAAGLLFCLGMVVFGVVFIIAPVILPGNLLTPAARTILVGFGITVSAIGAILTVITRLYVKAESDVAWVRTGMGGPKAVLDGGTIMVPFAHSLTAVSLQTMKLKVDREGKDALLTEDKLRADVVAEFYIRVQKDSKAVLAAATSMGDRCTDAERVKELMFEKLVSSLRAVAATKTLNDLNSDREGFAKAVQEMVQKDLEPNGLTLETVTVSSLDQTPLSALQGSEHNVFDSQGLRTIAEITNKNLVERQQIELAAKQTMKEREVATARFLAGQDVEQAKAVAEAEANKANARAQAESGAAVFRSEQDRLAGEAAAKSQQLVELARVSSQQAVELANVEREKQVAVQAQGKDQAAREAEITKQRSLEIRQREMAIALAQKEQERALTEASRLAAEKDREAAAQAVLTVEVTAKAERDKAQAIIAKQAVAEQELIEKRTTADAEAYTKTKAALAAAEAAIKEAEATLQRAEAERTAKTLVAEGLKAEQLVPVLVAAEQVGVEQRRVEVLKQELSAKSANETIAVQLQVELAKIAAEKEAKIAAAQAWGAALSKANIQIWGDGNTLAQMQGAFATGQAHGKYVETLLDGIPQGAKDTTAELVKSVLRAFGGKTPTPEELAKLIAEKLPLGKK